MSTNTLLEMKVSQLPHATPATASPEISQMIRDLTSVTHADLPLVGGKGANLGEMLHVGLPVPPGFVITIDGYSHFRTMTGVGPQIDALLRNVPLDDSAALQQLATRLRDTVLQSDVPKDLAEALGAAYTRLGAMADGNPNPDALVAVRSSATAEDTKDFSFAGMFESVLGVRGLPSLLDAVRVCWASTFGARVLYYRLTRQMAAEMPVAVIVQRMVASEKSGVLFTVDPATRNTRHLVIEAAWGLGEVVVGGQVTPDHYLVEKDTGVVLERSTPRKDFLIELTTTGGTRRVDLASDPRAGAPVLSDPEIVALAELARTSETHYGAPQDMEFAIADDHIYLTQTRPITTLSSVRPSPVSPSPTAARENATPTDAVRPGTSTAPATEAPILHGLGASPGIATGPVRILDTVSQSAALLTGEILVARMTSPDWVPLMRRAAAIITDAGGMTSHAAIVSRELGIPCIVGTRTATQTLHTGMVVSVNGHDGTVVPGTVPGVGQPAQPPRQPEVRFSTISTAPVTATRLYVNLAEPERAAEIAQRDVDGVGLLRAEFMMLSALDGMHPREVLARGGGDDFVRRMAEKLHLFASAFDPRPVIYRAMDFRSNEFRKLTGGAAHEPEEENPMIGYRGCFRYTREPDLFALELRALAEVRTEFQNLHLMLPFVRTGWEIEACRTLIDASPLGQDRRLQLWVMAEVPSVVSWMDEYARCGVTGVSIGSNDLTQLILGVDRDSETLAPFYDERDRAVLDAIHAIITRAHQLGLTCSICGQAPSVHPEYAAQLVEWGIDSISVNPDAIERTRRNIATAEQRVILAASRRALLSPTPSGTTAH